LDSAEKEKLKQDAAAQSSGNLTLTPAGEAYRIDLKTVSGSDAVARQALPFEIRMSYEGLDGDAELLGIYRYEDGKFDFAGARHIKSEKIVNAMVNTGGTYTLLEYQKKFEDLSGHWAEDEIRRLSARHVVNGVGDSHFEPEGTATRAQCAAMLVRALGLPQVPPEEVKFGDVSAVSWYAGSVGAAVRSGIVKGTSDTTFSPDRSITRAELAVMASRILSDRTGKAAVDSGEILGEYQDAGKVPAWAQDGMAAAVDAGIVEGRGSGTLAPDAPVTRAEASAIILRLLEKLEQ
ncbi:MAG: S-layer homology domain-containing protein, partial [Moorella sp. (in: Bacteria)]|nr:S-layer homology domain-containing protein [Moorella sp. (in: firmicutes)]